MGQYETSGISRPGPASARNEKSEGKERAIRKEHRLGPEVPVVFLEAHLGDVSDFYNLPTLEVIQEEGLSFCE